MPGWEKTTCSAKVYEPAEHPGGKPKFVGFCNKSKGHKSPHSIKGGQ